LKKKKKRKIEKEGNQRIRPYKFLLLESSLLFFFIKKQKKKPLKTVIECYNINKNEWDKVFLQIGLEKYFST
jgi:hypothetical protein